MKAKIVLEDGTVFGGESFGACGERSGEIVFNTSITGYQEILTDPSYKGQIVVLTYPLIGNYGINPADAESRQPFIEGFIIRELSRIPSNWRSKKNLGEYLQENNILGIEGIDTRALTRHIRLKGAMKAVISTENSNNKSLVSKAVSSPGLVGRDLVKEVSCEQTYVWTQSPVTSHQSPVKNRYPLSAIRYKVIVIDCGVKFNILRELKRNNCEVNVVPSKITAEEILKMKPDGLVLSNGPGDPAGVPYIVETVKKLINQSPVTSHQLPIMGICFGHQLLGLALGAKTYKLKFGHHGANHPVKDLKSGKVMITAQNHCFCLAVEQKRENKYYMAGNEDVEITHINLNDGTCEGMRDKSLPIFSVQFHPEASPGPHDANYLFEEFIAMMKKAKA